MSQDEEGMAMAAGEVAATEEVELQCRLLLFTAGVSGQSVRVASDVGGRVGS